MRFGQAPIKVKYGIHYTDPYGQPVYVDHAVSLGAASTFSPADGASDFALPLRSGAIYGAGFLVPTVVTLSQPVTLTQPWASAADITLPKTGQVLPRGTMLATGATLPDVILLATVL